MKIGILTHHYVSNYGAFLQAYNLRAAIADMYPDADVRVIDYVNRKHQLINTLGCFRWKRGQDKPASYRQKIRLPRVFRAARCGCLPMTRRVYTAAQLNALHLDAVVVGSDEVWNYLDYKSADAVKFGAGLSALLIAYAPSVGGVKDFSDLPEAMRAGILRFRALSARDDNTAHLIEQVTGQTPLRVLDPVFLRPLPGDVTPRVAALTKTPYLLFYHPARMPQDVYQALIQDARHAGLRVLGAGEYRQGYDAATVDLSPLEWAALFHHAALVVTGTFHGVVFSLINGRRFLVAPDNAVRVQKIGSLLRAFGLENHLCKPEDIDWKDANALPEPTALPALDALRAQSLQYLRSALDSVRASTGCAND